jgi:hypothetical protein
LEIRLGATFLLSEPDGSERTIEPEAPEQLAPLLTLVGRMLAELTVTREGSLRITFSDGTTIAIDSHAQFEAFEVRGSGALESLAYLACRGGGSPWG